MLMEALQVSDAFRVELLPGPLPSDIEQVDDTVHLDSDPTQTHLTLNIPNKTVEIFAMHFLPSASKGLANHW